jgi:hypothetical protein
MLFQARPAVNSYGRRSGEVAICRRPDGRARCGERSALYPAALDKLHREGDLPAKEFADDQRKWLVNGLLHRDGDQPAVTHPGGESVWWRRGQLHRDGGKPPVMFPQPDRDVGYVDDRKHREGGPARLAGKLEDLEWGINGESLDVDMGDDVTRFARGLGGVASFPDIRQRTSLVGYVDVNLAEGNYVHVDVLFQVYGSLDAQTVEKNAPKVTTDGIAIRIIHPIDVLQSRLENVYGLREKQDEHGVAQLRLAVGVAKAFLPDCAKKEEPRQARPASLQHVARIERLARRDAGRKVAQRFDVYVADAIELDGVKHVGSFMTKKLPLLIPLMSTARAARMAAFLPQPDGASGKSATRDIARSGAHGVRVSARR